MEGELGFTKDAEIKGHCSANCESVALRNLRFSQGLLGSLCQFLIKLRRVFYMSLVNDTVAS
jgi:hypothetical protein